MSALATVVLLTYLMLWVVTSALAVGSLVWYLVLRQPWAWGLKAGRDPVVHRAGSVTDDPGRYRRCYSQGFSACTGPDGEAPCPGWCQEAGG